jgi:hypothetical protein
MRTHIITMITLMLDKHTLVKAGFSMKDSVHRGLGWSTPHQVSWPGDFTPPERMLPPTAAWWDMAAPVRKLYNLVYQPQTVGWCRGAGKLINISPHVGRLSSQVKLSDAEVATRTIPSTYHIDAREPRR